MADTPAEKATNEERVTQAKELYGRGSRNFCVKSYSEAADNLSEASSIFADVHGPTADECGLSYLLYAKALILLGTDENKLINVPEEDEEEEDDDVDAVADVDEDADAEIDDGEEAVNEGEKKDETENKGEPKPEGAANGSATNGEKVQSNGHSESVLNGDSSADCQPGTSSGTNGKEDIAEEEADDDKPIANLEVAWEVLELAVQIFTRQGETAYAHLAEAYSELAGISFENNHVDVAIKDYKNALDVYGKMKDASKRLIAELHYKIGLSYYMMNEFDSSCEAFTYAIDFLDQQIGLEKAKTEDKSSVIEDIEEMKKEITSKIVEVQETKQSVTATVEDVKKELAKIIVTPESAMAKKEEEVAASNSADAGPSSSSDTTKPKPTDISHLIKRKKPDTKPNESEESPAKKPAISSTNE